MADDLTIAIDGMSGDHGPKVALSGLEKVARAVPDVRFLICGDEARLSAMLKPRSPLQGRVEVLHASDVVAMDAKPSVALRRGAKTSMWRALSAVRDGEALGAVSAGNTGALVAMALFRLARARGVERPALAGLWPSRGPAGYTVALDLGGGLRAERNLLLQHALMGEAYARIALNAERPRIALLNVGDEPEKGPAYLREAAEMIAAAAPRAGAEFIGFIEAHAIPSGRADVVVTDGFSGNIALKSTEGTARLIGDYLSEAFRSSLWARLGAMAAYPAIRAFKRRIDPRRVNGGVMLGLNGLVVKSHGGADATGFAAAVSLAVRMARDELAAKIAQSIENTTRAMKDGV